MKRKKKIVLKKGCTNGKLQIDKMVTEKHQVFLEK